MENNSLQGRFRPLSSTVLPRTSFGCAHILQHQQQQTTDRHQIETIGYIAGLCRFVNAVVPVSYTHLTLPTTPYV